jgi:beta-glucanase (GH16 family)
VVATGACSEQQRGPTTEPTGNDPVQTEAIGQSSQLLSTSWNSNLCGGNYGGGCRDASYFYNQQGYRCKMNDEFGGDIGFNSGNLYLDGNKWLFENVYVNNERENYTSRQCADPAHASDWNYCVHSGYLTIQARNSGYDCTGKTDCGNWWGGGQAGYRDFTSGRIISKHKVALEYGYIEFKARLPMQSGGRKSGAWPAIWFLGEDINEGPAPGSTPWPWAPEFDLMEWQSPNGKMASNAIFIGNDGNMDACNAWPENGSTECYDASGGQTHHKFGDQNTGNPWTAWYTMNDWSTSYTGWHVYGLEWTSTYMKPYIDGVLQGTVNITGGAAEYNEPMFIIMNLALGGDLGGTVDGSIDWSQMTLDVDYMRWYQPGGGDACQDPPSSAPTASCSDGVQNQGEGGIDCGGPCAPCAATASVYQNCNYGGYAKTLSTTGGDGAGNYTLSQLLALGVNNDDLSSINVAPGYQLVAYYDDNFSGYSATYTGQTSCLVNSSVNLPSGTWNDQISSLRVQAIPSGGGGGGGGTTYGVGDTVRAEKGVQVGTQFEYSPNNGTSGTSVGYFDQGDSISFANVNFTGVGGMDMHVAGSNSGGVMEVHADSASGTLLGSYTMSSTGGWQTWTDRSMSFSNPISGSHTLFLTGASGSGILNIETFKLTPSNSGFTIITSSRSGNSGTGLENCSEGGQNVMDIGINEWISFDNVNFAGLNSFEARVASGNQTCANGSTIEIRRDSTSGTLLATCNTQITSNGWQSWTSVYCPAYSLQSGTGTMYLVFKGPAGSGCDTSQLPNIRYIKGSPNTVNCIQDCAAAGKNCGSFSNNCGGTVTCTSTCGAGQTCTNNVCTGSSVPTNHPATLEAENGVISYNAYNETGGGINGVILKAGGVDGGNGTTGQVCWNNVPMAGNTSVTVTYGNGEPAGDTLKLTLNGTQLGGNMSVASTGGWNTAATVSTSFGSQSTTGLLCLVPVTATGWVAKVDKISVQ